MATSRRQFLKTGAPALALTLLTPFGMVSSPAESSVTARKIKKGIMWGTVSIPGSVLEKMQAIKEAGFEGVEMNSHMDQEEVLKARDQTGLVIPSVCGAYHWKKTLSDPDSQVRAEGLEALQQTLRDAKRYGASSVLLVPGVVTKEVSYAEAWERSRAEIQKAISLASELGVKIAIENVGNQFLLSPLEAARYVDEFNSPWVGWHFDVGNIINYGWPEHWVRALGKRIVTLHIKEFSRKRRDKEGLWKGFEVELLEGDDDWPAVMKALDEIGFRGWSIAEIPGGDAARLKNIAERMDKILSS